MIRASPERIFAHLAHGEHLPRYAAPLWMVAEPAEKRGGTQVVTLRGYFAGLPVESVQRVLLRPPTSAEFIQIRGTLRALRGRCTLRSVEDGTELLYHLEADPAIPMITEDAARQFLAQFLERMLDRIKLAAERKVPARPRARVAASEAALPDAGDDEAEETEPLAPEVHVPESHAGLETAAAEPPPGEGAPEAVPSHPAASASADSETELSGGNQGGAQAAETPVPGPSPTGRRRRRRRHRRHSR